MQFIAIWQAWTAAYALATLHWPTSFDALLRRLTTILFSRLALDLRELSAAEKDGGSEFYSRTLRGNGSGDLSAVFTETEVEMIAPTCSSNVMR